MRGSNNRNYGSVYALRNREIRVVLYCCTDCLFEGYFVRVFIKLTLCS